MVGHGQNRKAMAQTQAARQWRQWSACAHPIGKSFPLTYSAFPVETFCPRQGATFTCTCNPWLWTIRQLLNSIHENTGTITTYNNSLQVTKKDPRMPPPSLQRKRMTWLWTHQQKRWVVAGTPAARVVAAILLGCITRILAFARNKDEFEAHLLKMHRTSWLTWWWIPSKETTLRLVAVDPISKDVTTFFANPLLVSHIPKASLQGCSNFFIFKRSKPQPKWLKHVLIRNRLNNNFCTLTHFGGVGDGDTGSSPGWSSCPTIFPLVSRC